MTTLIKPPVGALPVRVLPKSSVTGLFGPKGSGKSAAMAYYLESHRKRKQQVFYFPERYRFHNGTPLTIEQLVTLAELDPEDETGYLSELNGAAVGLDEFQVIFSKYRSSTMANRAVSAFMQQVRKRGVDLYFTSNDPGGIDEAAETQTDQHAFCKYRVDPRCSDWHLKDCQDHILVNFVDTHGRTGVDARFYDGRRRHTRIISNAITLSQYYNTFAAISAQEVAQMNASEVMKAYDAVKTGATDSDLQRFFRVFIIPYLVTDRGWTQILPGPFADQMLPTLTKDLFDPDDLEKAELTHIRLPLELGSRTLGRIFSGLGLTKKRGSGGNRYLLPEAGDLEDWLEGGQQT